MSKVVRLILWINLALLLAFIPIVIGGVFLVFFLLLLNNPALSYGNILIAGFFALLGGFIYIEIIGRLYAAVVNLELLARKNGDKTRLIRRSLELIVPNPRELYTIRKK